jgi:heme exporter protein D
VSSFPRARRLAPLLPLVIATIALARTSIAAVLGKLGHPGASLDDAYIHFQYARAIAEGHPFRYQAGEPISTGATSFAWPIVLSIPYALGLRGESIMWAAWVLSFAALGALAWEAHALTKPLAGRAAAIGAGAMTLFFGGFVWCAASGMEVVPFAWLIAHATRRAAQWTEDEARRTRRELGTLIAIAALAPLVRPEGAITSLVLGVAVLLFPVRAPASASASAPPRPLAHLLVRAPALFFVAAALVPQLLLVLLTGHPTTSTAQVKLLYGNPYFDLWTASVANARTLVGTLLDGEVWSAEFLPKGGAPLAFAGLAALGYRGYATGRPFRAGAILVIALSMFVPCTYVTFLWNRLRYLWPFATGWFIGLACLARVIGLAAARVELRAAGAATALVAGSFVGMLFMRLDWVIEDAAQSASGIDRQQVALGRWAAANLPKDARIGLNDTGAIAYFGDRRTFDVVGLTTPTEGRYWVAGQGSRLEHYEKMRKDALPTHFIVYPEWMGCEPVLGRALHEAVVTDSSILGGQIMRVYEARWDYLGTGEKPWTPLGAIADAVDVADLESERAHDYELLGARENEQAAEEGNSPDGAVVIDGGRTNRTRERFAVKLSSRGRGVARVQSQVPVQLRVMGDGDTLTVLALEPGAWTELAFDVPRPVRQIEVSSEGGPFTSFHYWFGE